MPVKNVPASDFFFGWLGFLLNVFTVLFFATKILSLFCDVTDLAFDNRFVNESNSFVLVGNPS